MLHQRYPSGLRVRRKSRHTLLLTAALVALAISPIAFYADVQRQDASPAAELSASTARPTVPANAEVAMADRGEWSPMDPNLTLKPNALAFAGNAPLATGFTPFNAPQTIAAAAAPILPQASEPAQPQQPAPEPPVAQAVQPVPLPVPRPAEFRMAKAPEAPKPETPRASRAPAAGPVQVAAAPSAPEDKPSFFEKLFGIKPARPPENALGYAALDTGNMSPSGRFNPTIGDATAVYDISAKVVIMPNGERLEAHSGLGDKLDDPRFVHVRMKGATPPGTYTLTEREALFHGVRAIRLNPVGGSAAIYGRDGILAHTYLLGPNGDSNGCVSFKNYDRFLQAFLRGEVKRLVVVAGRGQDALPRMVGRGRTS
ncbi:tlde1 domain-containing protein [Microvirga pakistanensis]|uniref:tlde1 domain-containing protein n=1 Tax=Microvirga pakistanensis TaxID=1682650 RepID=UPI001FCE621E|nr:tlde1 domain-containing protein [Microvirga pakistanensis]